ncbi:sulfotransferase 1A1-like [Littorina saxatilis]|uniref:sulfotransferase 1A1-like n=1 Tax=Littorina saxatilis TaxID=31220 RepID=UPI0038B5B9A6
MGPAKREGEGEVGVVAGGPGPNFVFVDGVGFPKFFETNRPMEEQICRIKALELREDDVIICAYPKCGTHWLWETTSMLLAGKADYDARTKEFAMMEAVEIEKIQDQPSPRILNTHVPVHMLPAQVKDKKVKVIHVYRNVKDVTVSLYFHAKQNPGMENFTTEMVVQDLVGSTSKGSYAQFLKDMDTFIKSNPDVPVFNVSFEETKEDPVSVVNRLSEFLGVHASPELCADIARATDFSNMKQADSNKQQLQHLPKVQMYRKGEVGDWKNHLTVSQSERLDALVKQLEGCNFRFRYTL